MVTSSGCLGKLTRVRTFCLGAGCWAAANWAAGILESRTLPGLTSTTGCWAKLAPACNRACN
jgi:hypothetical protein